VPYSEVTAAFAAEAGVLAKTAGQLTQADLDRTSPCPPWTTSELLCHVVIAARRIAEVPAATGPGELVTAAGYYRPDHRFSPEVNSDRIEAARSLARTLGGAAAISAAIDAACRDGQAILRAAPASAAVRTRHGDRMLLTDFARTRLVELAVHGLDLAAGLGRPTWMTPAAARVLEDLVAPGGAGPALRAALGCDRVGLIARLTGRLPLPADQEELLREYGVTRPALG
jgi:uncharacterized protein (TIGR03083 family)